MCPFHSLAVGNLRQVNFVHTTHRIVQFEAAISDDSREGIEAPAAARLQDLDVAAEMGLGIAREGARLLVEEESMFDLRACFVA